MNNNNNHKGETAQAFAAVQKHVLPGLGDAWDEAGPAVIVATQYALVQLAIDSRFPLGGLVEFITTFEALEWNAWSNAK